MDATVFLAQMWGPVMLAIGVGIFVSPKYYVKIYRDLEKSAISVLTFGVMAMAAGIAQVSVHNLWNTFPEGLISVLGWGTLLKGAVLVVAPGFADKGGDWVANSKLISAVGMLTIALGVYLCWFAYIG